MYLTLNTFPLQVGYADDLYCHQVATNQNWNTSKYVENLSIDTVIIKLYPFQIHFNGAEYLAVINKNNKKLQFFYDTLLWQKKNQCYQGGTNYCIVPTFVSEIDVYLFRKVSAIVDYRFGSKEQSGWILLFNIDGKPKYCFTREGEDLSNEVQLTSIL